MNGFDAIGRAASRDMVTTVGQIVSYRGGSDPVQTIGVVDSILDMLGPETTLGETRHICTLLREDVGQPHRGDTVITSNDNQEWVLLEELPSSDIWITEWSVSKR